MEQKLKYSNQMFNQKNRKMKLMKFPSIHEDRGMQRLLNDVFKYDWPFESKMMNGSMPAANVKETEKEFRLDLAVPGYQKEDFNLEVEKDVLVISAELKEKKDDENKLYSRKEFSFHSFSRSFHLPESVNAEKINAKYENGILQITIPKMETAIIKKKHIKVA